MTLNMLIKMIQSYFCWRLQKVQISRDQAEFILLKEFASVFV